MGSPIGATFVITIFVLGISPISNRRQRSAPAPPTFVITAAFMYTDRLSKLTKARENLATYQEQYDELIAKEEYYRNEISKLENEDYIAKLAREKYFKSEEGEIIFKLPEEQE